jgi:Uma2 family endonuclease
LGVWSDRFGGIVLDSSAGFRLPNGATRAPDAAWVSDARWQAVPARERERFARLVSEFVAEIVSPRDSLARQVAKMEEYAANGVSLGWLIIPQKREVRVFRPGAPEPECLADAESLAADESVLPGFVLDLTRIW